MADPFTDVPKLPAAVSPTGAPTLSQSVIRIAGPLIGLIAVIGFAPDALAAAGVAMPPAPAVVGVIIAWCKVIAVLGGGYLGINSQGKRVLPMLLLVCTFGLASCKTVDPIIVTGDSIVAAGRTFEATAAVFSSLHASHAITEQQYAGWYSFALRFKASFHTARMLYDGAAEGGDTSTQSIAAGLISSFIAELGTYEQLIAQIVHPDGGAR